jgi:hypothetical protein
MVNSTLSSPQLRNQILNTQPLDVNDPIRADRRLIDRDPGEAVRRGMSDVEVVTPKREATPPARSRPTPEPKTVDPDDPRKADRQQRLAERFSEAALRRNRENDQETRSVRNRLSRMELRRSLSSLRDADEALSNNNRPTSTREFAV